MSDAFGMRCRSRIELTQCIGEASSPALRDPELDVHLERAIIRRATQLGANARLERIDMLRSHSARAALI
jgi:hypothetical protein